MFWILLSLWVINVLLSVHNGKIRMEWLKMQVWLKDQVDLLLADADWLDEANQATVAGVTISDWAIESIKIGASLLFITQIIIFANLLTIVLFEDPYITTGALAFAQSGVFVYTWIMVQRYYKTKGMCYGVQVNVEALKTYRAEIENGDEHDTTDDGRSE